MRKILLLVVALILFSCTAKDDIFLEKENKLMTKNNKTSSCDLDNYNFNNFNFNFIQYTDIPPSEEYYHRPNLYVWNSPYRTLDAKPYGFYNCLYNDLNKMTEPYYNYVRPSNLLFFSGLGYGYTEYCPSILNDTCWNPNPNDTFFYEDNISISDYEIIRDEIACSILSNKPDGMQIFKVLNVYFDHLLCTSCDGTTRGVFVDVIYAN